MAETLAVTKAQSAPPHPVRRRGLSRSARDTIAGYLFTSPVIIGMVVWTAVPMGLSLYYAFTNYNILTAPQWAGFANFDSLLHSSMFLQAIEVTIVFAVISVPAQLIVGLAIAVLLNQRVFGMRLFRALLYVPAILPVVAGTEVWRWMFSASSYGVVNAILLDLHLISKPFPFFASPSTAMFSLILMSMWSAGAGMLIWLAGLQSIPADIYEAAEVDGAGSWRRFTQITIPLLTPTIFFNLITGVVAAMQTFVSVFVLGGDSGSPLGSLDFINVFIYRTGFSYFEMGLASAAAWVLFAFVLVLTLLIFRSGRRWVFYQGGVK